MRRRFKIPKAPWPDEAKFLDKLMAQLTALSSPQATDAGETRDAITPQFFKGIADIATNIWRARNKMVDSSTGEPREEMRRVYRHIEGALDTLRQIGFEIKDHTGESFDYGLPLKVVTSQPVQGITRETVIETLKPTIRWEKQIIQIGEVIIGTPSSSTSHNEQNNH